MPYTVRASYVLECPGHGARETWFFQQSSSDLTVAYNFWATTLEQRRLLLGAQAQVKALEVSFETNDLGVPVLNDSVPGYVYRQGFQSEDMADPELALLIRASNATRQKHRNQYLRMIWDSIEIRGGQYIVPQGSTWQTKFDAWVAKMLTLGVGYIAGTRGTPVNISSYTQTAQGQVTIEFAGNIFAGLAQGTKTRIRIYTARQPSQLSGMQVVQVNDDNTCTTVNRIAVLQQSTVGWTGSRYTYGFIPTIFLDAQKIAEHHIGRPLLESPGRRKARARI